MPVRNRTVRVTKDITARVLRELREMDRSRVLVGIPAADSVRNDNDPIGNAAIGYIQEFGAPAANIPARPFLVPGVRAALPRCTRFLRDGATAKLSGDDGAFDLAQMKAGLEAVSSVRKVITDGIPPPLAPSTLAKRKSAGFQGTKPLVVTGNLRNAVTFVKGKRDG